MSKKVSLLDCTLRDGAYINSANFGAPAIKGLIKKMQEANIEVIECGWLKDTQYTEGTSYFHVPSDIEPYLLKKDKHCTYVVMIDWDRYNTDSMSEYDGKSIDAVRVVFPHGKHLQGIEVGKKIRKKGYRVFFQIANTLAYSDEELVDLVAAMNEFMPESLSVVDTFGAMYPDDVERILHVIEPILNQNIKLGFHAHNNQQLAFSNAMRFVELLQDSDREVIVDSSLCGMGRGAGNATTELMANYINVKYNGNYDVNAIMDAIDMYMEGFKAKYTWGYSTQYFIAGMYQCHVNNIAYLLDNHRTNSHDMRQIIESLSTEERRKYDYDLLESKYLENQNRIVDDENTKKMLSNELQPKKVLLLAPGKTLDYEEHKIKQYIENEKPIVIGVNAFNPKYNYDFMFFVNNARYEYAKEAYENQFLNTKRILLSNIKTKPSDNELIINYENAIKRGWRHFDNAVICCLRLMNKLGVEEVILAGFDGFKDKYNESYCDESLPSLNTEGRWEELNKEIKHMFADVVISTIGRMKVEFLTDSIYQVKS